MNHTIYITTSWRARASTGVANKLRDAVRAQLQVAGRQLVDVLKAQSAAVKWKGRYRTGWIYLTKPWELTVKNKYRHAIFIEKGRRAGAKPPPVAAIAEWVRDKLGPAANPYLVARSIGRKGIRPRPAMYDDATQRKMHSIVHGCVRAAMAKALTAHITGGP
jgi:hypothetical protein